MISQCAKFEVFRLTRFEAMYGSAKCRTDRLDLIWIVVNDNGLPFSVSSGIIINHMVVMHVSETLFTFANFTQMWLKSISCITCGFAVT